MVLQILGEFLLEAALELVGGLLKELLGLEELRPALATAAWGIVGAAVAGLSVWLLPGRIFRPFPIPGISLVVTPLALGWAMQAWGRHRERAGHSTTSLATWYGGGALALGLAATRYAMLP